MTEETVVLFAPGISFGLLETGFDPELRVVRVLCLVCGERIEYALGPAGTVNGDTLQHEDWCKLLQAIQAMERGQDNKARCLIRLAQKELRAPAQ